MSQTKLHLRRTNVLSRYMHEHDVIVRCYIVTNVRSTWHRLYAPSSQTSLPPRHPYDPCCWLDIGFTPRVPRLAYHRVIHTTHVVELHTEFLSFAMLCPLALIKATVNFYVRPSVCMSACLSSVTFVRPTQVIEIFANVSTPSGTLAICDLSVKLLRRSSQGNPSVGGVKHKRVSRI